LKSALCLGKGGAGVKVRTREGSMCRPYTSAVLYVVHDELMV
jgi:hypothetical protein